MTEAANAGGAPDRLLDEILDVFAREARLDRAQLRGDARADELGIASLDLALALFEIEDRYDIKLPEPAAGAPLPTVDEIAGQVRDAIAARGGGASR